MRSPTVLLAGRVGSQGSTGGVVVKRAAGPRAPRTAPLPPSDRPRRGRPEAAEATAAPKTPPRRPKDGRGDGGAAGPRGDHAGTRLQPPALRGNPALGEDRHERPRLQPPHSLFDYRKVDLAAAHGNRPVG